MVKLQKRFAYRYKSKQGTKDHYKFQITIPEEFVKALGWKTDDDIELKLNADGNNLSLSKKLGKNGGSSETPRRGSKD